MHKLVITLPTIFENSLSSFVVFAAVSMTVMLRFFSAHIYVMFQSVNATKCSNDVQSDLFLCAYRFIGDLASMSSGFLTTPISVWITKVVAKLLMVKAASE